MSLVMLAVCGEPPGVIHVIVPHGWTEAERADPQIVNLPNLAQILFI
jgi:hypothetical protein